MIVPRLVTGEESFALDEIAELYLSIACFLYATTQFLYPTIQPQLSLNRQILASEDVCEFRGSD